MDNCTYDKAKLLHELGKLSNFIEQYAKKDSQNYKKCNIVINEVKENLETQMEKLKKALTTH